MEAQHPVEHGRDKRFALLIDADNVSAKYIKPILNELNKYGTVTYKRIYGDWTLTLHAKWKDALLENSITPIQQFSYTYGKNSTDSAMIIDAMDILYGGGVEGFCIVSSDSDFTRLASRLRESGHTVIGMGEKKTPTPFRKACDIFTVLELLVKDERREKANGPTMSKAEVEQAVVDIIIDNQNNGKATGLGEIGSRLQKRYPDFDVRNYGTNLLSKLLGEFTRVKITKDHSSVAVELADATDAGNTNGAPEPKGTPAAPAPVVEAGAVEEPAASTPEAPEAESGEPASEERKPSRRSRRSRRIKVAREEATEPAPEEEPEPEAEPQIELEAARAVALPEDTASEVVKPARKPRRRKKAEAPAEEVVEAETAADAAPIEPEPESKAEPEPKLEPEPKAEAKPARKPRRRKKAEATVAEAEAQTEAEALETPDNEPAVEPAVEPGNQAESNAEPEEAKPTRKPRRRKKPAPEAAPEPEAAPTPEPEAETESTPASFIRDAIVQAGAEGIALTQLGEDIRTTFKDFKVRDLGFPQLRLYLASIEDFEVIKDGKAFRVALRP